MPVHLLADFTVHEPLVGKPLGRFRVLNDFWGVGEFDDSTIPGARDNVRSVVVIE